LQNPQIKEGPTLVGAFFAFADALDEVRESVRQAAERCRTAKSGVKLVPWTDLDVSGRLIQREVLAQIDLCDIFIADISALNLNVSYEVGYAIGVRKPLRLVVNEIYKAQLMQMTQRVGIFDTVGSASTAMASI
jgi:nucleoside 2-deoxyribosyltransferase